MNEPRFDPESLNPQRLRIARQLRGLSRRQLARLLDVSLVTISAWERGDRLPERHVLDRLGSALHFPVEWFWADDMDEVSPGAMSIRRLT